MPGLTEIRSSGLRSTELRTAELRDVALRHGRDKKRNNAIAAVVCGALPAFIAAFYFPSGWNHWLVGLGIGVLWGNAFEYAYHRWLLHRPHSPLGKGHVEHHANVGTTEEAEHVSLGRSPLHVALLFASNGVLLVLIDSALRLGITAGVFLGWALYLLTTEEIHWRIHLNEWLPPGLRFARAYHMRHHDTPNIRYNVFLPVFDLLLGSW